MFLPVTIAKLVRSVYGVSPHLVLSSSRVRLLNCTRFANVSDRKRFICTTRCLQHGEYEWQDPKTEDEVVSVVYVDKDGKRTEVRGKVGDNILYLAHRCVMSLYTAVGHVLVLISLKRIVIVIVI